MADRTSRPLIPPHIGWPLLVVLLLTMSVGTVTTMVLASRSDGGAQVIDDYYRKAVAWDTLAAERRASAALGWHATLAVEAPAADTLRAVLVTVVDRQGVPVAGLSGTVQAGRPHRATLLDAQPLAPADVPGTYRLALRLDGEGLWDFEVRAHRADERFVATLRHEIRARP